MDTNEIEIDVEAPEKDCDGFRGGDGISQCCMNCARYRRPYHPTNAMQVKELREWTGAGIKECRNALEITGSFDAAKDFLREAGYAVFTSCTRMVPLDGNLSHAGHRR